MNAFASTSAETFADVSRLSDAACGFSFFGVTMPNSLDKAVAGSRLAYPELRDTFEMT